MSEGFKRRNAFSSLRRWWSWLRFPTYALLFCAWWQYTAATWLRDHGDSTASIEALKPHLEAGVEPLSIVAGEALAAIRSRLGEFAGGLALSETQDAGALSLAVEGGQLAVAEQGQLSVEEEEAERKRRGAVERQKG